jgi:hypothetical protein
LAGQALQASSAAAPDAAEKVPAAQSTQVLFEAAPITVENLPETQF